MTDDDDMLNVNARITRLEETLVVVLGLLSEIRRDIGRASAPVALDAPDGTVAIRDPDIVAQRQLTGTFGYAPYVPPE